jgi:hypothetical protein
MSEIDQILLLLAQRHYEKIDAEKAKLLFHWYSYLNDAYLCHICGERNMLAPFADDFGRMMRLHGIKHLKEYGLIAYL